MITVTATDFQNNFGYYLKSVQMGDEVIVIKNGREIARFISRESTVSFLTDSLKGILKNDYDDKAIRKERYETNETVD